MTNFPYPIVLLLFALLLPHTVSSARAQTGESEKEQVLTLSQEDVGPYRPQHTPDLTEVRELIGTKTNALRKTAKLDKLKRNKGLDAAAQQFAEYMARTNRYSHRADGQGPGDRVKEQKYKFCLISENIAYHFATESFETAKLAEQATQGWIDSPGHRRNMVNPHSMEIGIGIAQSESTGIFYAVQLFGRPASATISFEVANSAGQSVSYMVGKQQFELPAGVRRRHQACIPLALQLISGSPAGIEQPGPQSTEITPQDEARYTVTIVDEVPMLSRDQ